MFKDEKTKDMQEHQFNFGDQDVSKFQEKLKTKMDMRLSKKERQRKANEEMEDVDFIGSAEVPASQSMEHLNLFGVPLDSESSSETIKEKNDKRRFVRELIDVMQAMDSDNTTQDFA